MTQRSKRILLAVASLIAAIVVGAVGAAWLMLSRSVPITGGELIVPGVENNVEITFDSLGIPQIWAETEHDGFFALGYQHAADRMFQMDLIRRVAQGRLAEALGSAGLDWDIHQRTIGHHRLARTALDKLTDVDRARLQAYADGVNAYAATCRAKPFEFRLLPIDFERWTVYDCLTVFSYQTWFSNALQSSDETYRNLAEKVGAERAAELADVYPDWAPVTIPDDASAALDGGAGAWGARRSAAPPGSSYHSAITRKEGRGSTFQTAVMCSLFGDDRAPLTMTCASNAWVVGPDKSSSGHAMLASDPHLEVSRLPQFWYCAGLHIKQTDVNVVGITVPGLPFFVMGHNGAAAWAFTVAGIDVNDYYLERINPDDSTQYAAADGFRPFEIFVDTIAVAGLDEPDMVHTRATERGPIVSDAEGSEIMYSLHWAGFDADLAGAVAAGFGLAGVADFETFRPAVASLGALDANWMYADSGGNIGYQLGTPLAVRSRVDAVTPAPGWENGHMWRGYRSLEETPHALNPGQGWLASCNNLPGRGYDLVGRFASSRITRIDQLMHSYGELGVADMCDFQMDINDVYLLRWRDTLAAALAEAGKDGPALWTREWRGECDTNSIVPGIMSIFLDEFQERFYADELGDLAGDVPRSAFERELWQAIDDSARHSLIVSAARVAADLAGERPWGQMQTLTMRHPVASVPVLGGLLNLTRGPYAWAGSPGTLNAAISSRSSDSTFRTIVAPSWRFAVDFADVDAATVVLPAGNSGNPVSEHFFDFFERYRTGERWILPFHYDRVRNRAVSTLTLSPVR